MKKWIGNIIEYFDGTKDEHVSAFAGQSAFFIFLSIFPLLNILLSLMPLLSFSEETLVDILVKIFPKDLSGFVRSTINDIYSKGSPGVTIISVVAGLWSASKGIMAIRDGLNEIYRSRDNRNFLISRLISVFYTAVFVVFLVLLAAVSIFGRQLAESIGNNFEHLKGIMDYLMNIKGVVSFLIAFLLILLMYAKLPKRKLSTRCQIPGAIFAAGAWSLISWGFSYYIEYAMKQSYMYGSLTTIIFLLFWIYLMVNIIFFGAHLNAFLYKYVLREWADRIEEKKAAKRAVWRARFSRVFPRLKKPKKLKKLKKFGMKAKKKTGEEPKEESIEEPIEEPEDNSLHLEESEEKGSEEQA